MYEAEKLCDKIALLNEGNIVEYGAPADICRRYNHQKKIQIHLKNGQDIELVHGQESAEQIKTYKVSCTEQEYTRRTICIECHDL